MGGLVGLHICDTYITQFLSITHFLSIEQQGSCAILQFFKMSYFDVTVLYLTLQYLTVAVIIS